MKKHPPPSERTVPAPPDTARMPVGVDYREEMPTYSDPVELEAARIKSSLRTLPPSRPAPTSPAEGSPTERLGAYERLFGGFGRVPIVVVSAEEIASKSLDGRASMLLALLDGRSSIQTILDIGIVNTLDTLAGLAVLLERGVIGFR